MNLPQLLVEKENMSVKIDISVCEYLFETCSGF